jgi:hypothetical protein
MASDATHKRPANPVFMRVSRFLRLHGNPPHPTICVYPGVYQEALRVPIHWYTRCEVLDGQVERRDDRGMDQIG